jgi:hypothetical protein
MYVLKILLFAEESKSEQSEMFNKVLLCAGKKEEPSMCTINEGLQNGEKKNRLDNPIYLGSLLAAK